jgi:hypothetical protein
MKLFQAINRGKFLILLVFIVLAFFNKSTLGGLIPYPGDLIVANYEPYKSYFPGVPHKAQGPDVARELIPWKHFVVESFKKGEIPFWNPHNFSGNPLLANFQSAVFYPANILFFVLDFADAWTLYIILSSVLSSIFMYLFLRRLKLSNPASVLGSVSYTFSLYMTVWIQYGNIGHTLMFLPLVLFFTDLIIEKISYRNFIGLVLSLFLSILAGYIQGAFYVFLVALIYFFGKSFFTKKISKVKSLIFLSTLTFPILLSLFQLLPTLELFANSTRGAYTTEQIQRLLNPIWYLITVIAPDFFGNPATRNYWFDGTYIERVSYFGLIPLIFAIFAIWALFRKTEVKIFSLIFLGTIILTTDLLLTKFFYLLPIPVISTAVPTRMLSLFAFSGSVLAAFGLDHFLRSKNPSTGSGQGKRILLISGVILALLAGLFLIMSGNIVAQRNLVLPIGTLIIFILLIFAFIQIKSARKIAIFSIIIIGVVSLDLYFYFQKITPFAPAKYMYPETPVIEFIKENAGINRFWGYGSAYIESNFQTFDGTFSPEGIDPLHIRDYTQLLSSSRNGQIPEVLPRPDANIAQGFGKEELANNLFRQKVLNIVGVKYVLNKDETINGPFNPDYVTFPEDRYKLVWQDGFWQAYENINMTPRFFMTNKFVLAEDSARALKTLYDSNFNERDTLILYEDPGGVQQGNLNSEAFLSEYSPNKVIIKTNADKTALLYLSDNYYPGWKAYVNGQEAKILRANYAFRAVVVPPGANKVIFEFKPKTFYYGLYAAFAAAVSLLLVSWLIRKKYG